MPELQLHGPPCVTLEGGRRLSLSAREAALLAWLHLEGPSPRAALAGRLWPGGDEAKARANLRQTLLRLKRAAGELLAEQDGRLQLASSVTVATADDAPLLGALEFDAAPELADWLAARRDAHRRERLRVGLATARERLAAGDLDAALAAADALLAADAAVEEAHRLRMEVFYLRGDRAAAITAWDACRDALRSAFGIAPSAPTNDLGRLILAAADAPAPAAVRRLPAALRRPPRLVGRDAVLADIVRALALGRGVVVAGVGGIGKSRLLAEAAAMAAPVRAGLSVGARPGDELLPGVLVARLLGAALPRFAPVLDAATHADVQRLLHAGGGGDAPALQSLQSHLDQRRLFASLARALDACRAMGLQLVVLDDLQFADTLSLAALQVLVGGWLAAAPGTGIAPMLGLRADALGADAARLLTMLDGSGRCTRFDLAPLQAADVRALLDGLPLDAALDRDALAAALQSQVGGNPAWLLESLKNLWLDGFAGWSPGQPLPLPATLLDSVRQRLQRLPDDALQLAQLAAVARGDFSPALAGVALGRTPLQLAPVLGTLEAAQVFHGGGFSHDLVAEAVQRSLPAALRPALHRVVADFLVAHGGAAAAIAHHLAAAGDTRAAAPWQLQAAQRARAQWQMLEAAAAYETAARWCADEDAAARLAAWLGAARCWVWADRDAAAQAALAAAEALASTRAERAHLLAVRTVCHFNARRVGDTVRGAELLVDELAAVADELAPTTLTDALRVVTSSVPYGADVERALALAARLHTRIAGAPDHDDDALLALRTATGGLLHWASRPLEAGAELQAAWLATRPGRDAGTRVMLGNQLMRVRHALGDLPGAIAIGHTVLDESAPLQVGAVFTADVHHVIAMMEVASGRAADGLARFDALLQRLHDSGVAAPDLFITSQALACMACGRLDDAAALLARHPPAGRDGMGLQDLGWHLCNARLAVLRGASSAHWLALAWQAGALPPGLLLQRETAIASIAAPVPGDAAVRAALAARLQALGLRGLQRVAEVAAARAALAEGQPAVAAAHVRRALALAAQVDAWVDEPASVWWAGAEVLAACGHADEADAVAAQGAAWVRAGIAQWTQPAAREAWQHGNPAHRVLLRWHGGDTTASD